MNYHLAILSHGWIELILDGKKTIESRFTKVRCAPFGKVHKGDVVYLKESSGLVKGMFTVAKVETFEGLDQSDILELYQRYGKAIFYQSFTPYFPPYKWLDSKYATLIHVSDPIAFENPFTYRQKGRSAWLVLDAPLHECKMCDERFLLEAYETPDGELIHGSEHFCPPCYARECVSPDEEVAMG